MKTLRTLTTLLVLLFLGCQPTKSNDTNQSNDSFQNQQPNHEIAIKFINDYVEFLNDRDSKLGLIDWVKSQSTVTEKFNLELERIINDAEKREPGFGLGFDPLLDAQDYPDRGFEFEQFDIASGYLIVKGIDWESFKLTIKLIEKDGKWLVDGSGIVNVPDDKRIKR